MEIIWTDEALSELQITKDYLLENWSQKEIDKLEEQIKKLAVLIGEYPEICQATAKSKLLRKGIVGKHNFLIYSIVKTENKIVIVTFRGTRMKPKY